VLTGRILDEFGEPLSGIQVSAVRSVVVNGARRMLSAGRIATTNDLGEFRLFGVPPGQYYVQASWQRMQMQADPASSDRTGYPITYFPGTTEVADAQRLTLGVGQLVEDLAMTLSPIKTATVSGTATAADGSPFRGMLLVMRAMPNGGTSSTSANIVRPDGSFTFTLSPGEYTLRTMSTSNNSETASLAIRVGSEDIKDLHLVAVAPSKLAGRIIVDPAEATSLPPVLSLIAQSVVPVPMPGTPPARVADDLTFEVTALPGRTRLFVINLPPTWALRSVRVDNVEVTDDGIDVRATEDVTGVEVELTTHVTSVSGMVSNGSSMPVKNYSVVIFPVDTKRWGPNSRYLRVGRPDQDGRFKVSGLPAGDYEAIALERLEQGQNTDPEFLGRVQPRATTFSLLDGETKTLDLKLSSGS
jgi:hypothetical protein